MTVRFAVCSNQPLSPSCDSATIASLRAFTFAMSTRTSPPIFTPYSPALRATCAARALAMRVFVGMHPLLTHVPPSSFRSMIAVLRPDCARRTARDGPACPAPMTIASKFIVSEAIDVDDRLRKRLRRFLREVVTDAALHHPVFVAAREFLRIRARVGVRRTICIAFERDRRRRDHGSLRQLVVHVVVPTLAVRQTEPPAIIVDDDRDVIRIIEGRRGAIERRIVECPLRRSELPDELVEIAPVFLISDTSAFGRKI